MERGTEHLMSTLKTCNRMEIRHARRGWLQECACCITKSSFKYYIDGKKSRMAESKEEFSFCCRCCLAPHHSFDMTINAPGTENEILEFNRPCRCPLSCGKCCCFQEGTIFSGEDDLGEIRETCWLW